MSNANSVGLDEVKDPDVIVAIPVTVEGHHAVIMRRMTTIRDVAKHARVSTATVSAVLNRSSYVSPKLTAQVNEAVDALDYSINELARGLQTRSTKTIGMLVPDFATPFHATLVRGILG